MRGYNFVAVLITAVVLSQLDVSVAIHCYSCTSANASCLTDVTNVDTVDCGNKECAINTTDTGVIRGCSNATDAEPCKSPSCIGCNMDKCNLNVVCYSCTGESCNTVKDEMLLGCPLNDRCFSSGTSATNMTRGCTSNTANANCSVSTTEGCSICDTGKCNSQVYEEFECYSCSSSLNSACWDAKDTSKLETVSCTNGTCFSGYWNRQFVRDCFSSASSLMQYQCTTNVTGHQCQKCEISKCNTWAYNGASSLNHVGVAGILIVAFITLRNSL
ncbi:uncharacterized protein [Drosophila bipectinata]|uniref:uncharacterized protein n=1 Tax=Drosophila bipectinata TaxID=42026 RepID=UPI001C8ABC6A|nr:uncharacterized protein LOC108125852 [Drosophila bipectinata]